MPSSFNKPTPPLDLLYHRFIRHHLRLLRVERLELEERRLPSEAHQRWLRADPSERSAFQKQADKRSKKYQRSVDEYERRKALPCTTQQLSSLRRPARPSAPHCEQLVPHHPAVSCLDLVTPLLQLLLSFVPDVELFFVFPRLSASCRWSFTDAALHRRHGQQRFGLSDCQWRLYSARPYPQLSVPVHRYAYYGYHQPFGVERFDDRKDAAPCAGEKDWALESVCLQQHLRFATLAITSRAPTHTVAGRRLQYRLPRLIRALLVDQLTSRAVTPLVKQMKSTYYLNDSFLNLGYANCFGTRRSIHTPVVLSFACGPSPHTSASPVRPRYAAAVEAATSQPRVTDVSLDGQAMSERIRALQTQLYELKNASSPLDELMPLGGGHNSMYKCSTQVCLWFREALRQAASRDADLRLSHQRSEPEGKAILVDLEHCPVLNNGSGYSPAISVLAPDVGAWLSQPPTDAQALRAIPAHASELLQEWMDDTSISAEDGALTNTARSLRSVQVAWLAYIRGLLQQALVSTSAQASSSSSGT